MPSDRPDDEIPKKRRLQRACDTCRRKKIRCDGGQMPKHRCSNCIEYHTDCSYNSKRKKRISQTSYVEALEARLEKTDMLLRRLVPEADVRREMGSLITQEPWAAATAAAFNGSNLPDIMRKVSEDITSRRCIEAKVKHRDNLQAAEEKYLEDDLQHLTLVDTTTHTSAKGGNGYRFFGRSSDAQLIRAALDMKGATGCPVVELPALPLRCRPEHWKPPHWEVHNGFITGFHPNYSFPPLDLMHDLIDLYFTHLNVFIPLLHRPTFERQVANGLHIKDNMFAGVLVLVCACASRYSDDKRVLLDGESSRLSSGWKWYNQMQQARKSSLALPGLYDLQIVVLLAEFLAGSSTPQASWTMVGIGIRLAEDVGAHRRTQIHAKDTVEGELWKRAFWALVVMDRAHSAVLGRPCAIHDEDFDIDFPVECDDEYWETDDPEQAFKQLPGKPSYVAFFNTYLRLNHLLFLCLTTIYSLNKSKILLGLIGPQWEQSIVSVLDSALNQWLDTIPDHLRWDPNRENIVHFSQSAYLYMAYYNLQMLVHRPFIPTPKNPSPNLSFPSLSICTNAARSCIRVGDIYGQRSNRIIVPTIGNMVFAAGLMLLFSIWGGKRSKLSLNPEKQMKDVHKAMKLLQAMETNTYHMAGRLWDILHGLASVSELPLATRSPDTNHQQDCYSGSAQKSQVGGPGHTLSGDRQRDIVLDVKETVARRTPESVSTTAAPTTAQTPQELTPPQIPQSSFTLPMYSNELGGLAMHEHGGLNGLGEYGNDEILRFSEATQPRSETLPVMNDEESFYGISLGPGLFDCGEVTSYGEPGGMNEQQMNDAMGMWSSAPTGFELDDWGPYITHISEMMHA